MSRRALIATLATICLLLASAFTGLLSTAAPAAAAPTTQPTFLTFYGWWDNTPPGGDIAYPQIHNTAGGKGTYADPITFATSTAELPAGTKVWVPRVKKYFIMEDSCQECGEDWSGHGPNGGPGLRHIDLWLGGKGGSAMDAIDCEDALTHYNPDGKPTMEPVVVNPGANEAYDPTPIFNTSTGECYGGAKPNTTIGQYKNGSSSQCLEDPNNSGSPGTQLKTAACNGSAAQRFTFHGAFLIINDLCAAMSGGKVALNTCTGGPSQQWSINPSGTISDIQTGQKCVRASGTSVVAGSCSGAASQWAFTAASTGDDFSLALNPASGTVSPGASTTSTVSAAVVSGSAQPVTLSATGAPSGVSVSFDPPSVTPGSTSTMTVTAAAGAAGGSSTVTVTGTSASTAHSAGYALTVTGSGGTPVLLSQGKTATASSVESSSYPAGAAFDGNLTGSRWSSKEGADPQWLRVDLGTTSNISGVKLSWEAAYGKAYTIQTSADGTAWTTIYSTTGGNGGTDELTGLSGTGRYVRMNGTARGTSYGYSLYEMQVYGSPAAVTVGDPNPWDDPNLVSMFDGKSLDGWTASKAGGWTVKNGTIHGTGKAGRGWIYYNKQQAGSFRWIFNVRQVSGNHAPTVLMWGTTEPIRDALSAIQFQPPNGGHWDYRPGHNNGGGDLFKKFPHDKIDVKKWSQCELLANADTGKARMACCPLKESDVKCRAVEILDFFDRTAARVGPLAIQVHNGGIQDEYRSLFMESPVADPDTMITMK